MCDKLIEDYKILKMVESGCKISLRDLLTPTLTDVREIDGICRMIESEYSGRHSTKDLCLCVVIRLYSPESLLTNKRVRRGVTRELAKSLGANYSYTSKLTGDVRVRYTAFKSFRSCVEEIVERVKTEKEV